MTTTFITYGFYVYFVGLIFAGAFALIGGQWKKSAQLFVLMNTLGLVMSISYLLNFAPNQILITELEWFFDFSPTLTLLSGIFLAVISGVSALVGIYALKYLELYAETYNPAITQFLTVFFVLGMQGVLLANNTFAFMFFWEVMSVASFFLVLADKTQESIKAAFLYFIMTHLGASAILGGFLILGGGSLFFDFDGIAVASQGLSPFLLALSFLLFLFGFGSKAGLVPFHVWLPEAHPQAPSNISALMSGLMLKVAVYGFLKVVFSLMNLPAWAGMLVIGLGLLSGIVGVLYAVIERDMKRAFAYSSIENMGIIFTMLGVALFLLAQKASEGVGLLALSFVVFAILHAVSHALFKTALFLSSGVVISRFHTKNLEAMGGLAKIMPIFGFAFLLAILASMPIPPMGTFFGEWGFIQGLIGLFHEASLNVTVSIIVLAVLALLGLIGGLAVFAMVKIFGISMLGLPRTKHLEKREEKKDYLLILPIAILSLSVLALGAFAKTLLVWLMANVEGLLGLGNLQNLPVSKLSSATVFLVAILIAVFVYILKMIFAGTKNERAYQTWDCGQPIDATMEYSATAFSAPIRFFFLHLLKRDKKMTSEAVVATNPWIRKHALSITFESVWKEMLYEPLARILGYLAHRMKVIQGGRIQYYLLFVLGTLIITLITVL